MASAPDTVTEMRSAKAKIHSAVPPITPRMGGAPCGGAMWKWALTMARNSVGHDEIGHQLLRHPGRHGQHDHVAAHRAAPWRREIPAPGRARVVEHERAQPLAQFDIARPSASRKASAGSMKAARQGWAWRCGDGRRGRPWPASRASPAGQLRRTRFPARCSAPPAGRAASAAPTARPWWARHRAMRLAAAGEQQRGIGEIVAGVGAGHAAACDEHPPGQRAVVGPQASSARRLARSTKAESRARRARPARPRAPMRSR